MHKCIKVEEAWIPSPDEQKFLLRVFSMYGTPGLSTYTPKHRHPECEIALIQKGNGIYTVAGVEYRACPGDIFLFGSDEPHLVTFVDTPDNMEWLVLHFEPQFIWSPGNGLFDSNYLRIFLKRGEHFSNRLDRENGAVETVRRQLLDIHREMYERPPEYALMVKVGLMQVLVTLLRYFNFTRDARESHYHKSNLLNIEKSMCYIQENISEPLRLEDLAKQANMSASYFSAVFRKLNGISPWDYIITRRVNYAIGCLRDSDATVLEIALKSGFNNTANFNRAFRKVTGRSPRDYRADNYIE